MSSLVRANQNASHNIVFIRVYSWLKEKIVSARPPKPTREPRALPRVVSSVQSVVCLRSGSTIQRFDDLTAAKQFVFIRVYSWLTFADGCG